MVTSPLESTMVQQAGISATPSYHRLGANSLPGLLPRSSFSECLKPQQPQPLWPRCKGERKVSHMFPHAQVLRETKGGEGRGGEGTGQDRTGQETHSLFGPFKCFLITEASASPPTTAELSREKLLWRQGGSGTTAPSHTRGVLRGCSTKAPSCHPPTLTCYILTSSVKWFFGLP